MATSRELIGEIDRHILFHANPHQCDTMFCLAQKLDLLLRSNAMILELLDPPPDPESVL